MLTVDDEQATKWIDMLFGRSAPGDTNHSLLLVREGGRTPIGVSKPEITVYAIAPSFDNAHQSEQFIAQTITAAASDPTQPARPVLAVLAMEVVGVLPMDDEVAENRARVLHARGDLQSHPAAIEATQLYAAAADGRRWTGRHLLTGPNAGHIDGPTLHHPGSRSETFGGGIARLVRAAVGLTW